MDKLKCRRCGKSTGKMKYYIIADDMEKPKPYHEKCMKEFTLELMINILDEN